MANNSVQQSGVSHVHSLSYPRGDGDFEALFTLGGRSFSIGSADGTQVYDSGSELEHIVAAGNPQFFNASKPLG